MGFYLKVWAILRDHPVSTSFGVRLRKEQKKARDFLIFCLRHLRLTPQKPEQARKSTVSCHSTKERTFANCAWNRRKAGAFSAMIGLLNSDPNDHCRMKTKAPSNKSFSAPWNDGTTYNLHGTVEPVAFFSSFTSTSSKSLERNTKATFALKD